MSQPVPKYHWAKQEVAEDCEIIECPSYDPINNFVMEPAGCYVLIRVNRDAKCIELAICTKDHKIIKVFRGRKCQDIYFQIFEHEKKNNAAWFKEKSHIAYVGKELKKAELALETEKAYIQE